MTLSRIFGTHSLQAALDYSPEKIRQCWLDKTRQNRRCLALQEQLLKLKIPINSANSKQLDCLADGGNHQGVIIAIELPQQRSEQDLKVAVQKRSSPAFYLVLDHIQDPHNLGACLRTADATGAHGVIITKDQAVGLTPSVCKVASGAAETVPLYQVTNLSRTLRWLKQQNIWVIGAAEEAEQIAYQMDLTGPLALVIGAEGKGLRRLVKAQCDMLIKLPMQGQVESLNLSVATGVLLYEALRQRL